MAIAMIGLDTAKNLFQVHGLDEGGRAVLRRKLHRSELVRFFEQQPRCTVFLEACGAGHYWGRLLSGFGHEVKLIAPEAVRPFVKRGRKNDAADAAALCVAGTRPETRFVPIKSVEQQAVLALHAVRSLLVKQQTMLANALRGLAGEFGVIVPRQHSTGGRTRLGGITKAGNAEIRRLLVLGATSMVWRATCWDSKAGLWVRGVLARRPVRLVTVALANKLARIAWELMTRGEVYQAQGRAPAAAAT